MPETTDDQGNTETISEAVLTTTQSTESRSSSSRTSVQSFVAPSVSSCNLLTILKAAANWSPSRLMKLAQEIEEREPHYRSVLGTRKMAVSGLDWSVTAASEDARDEEIAAFVKSSFEKVEFEGLLTDLLDGLSKGYSVVEVVWKLDEDRRLVPGEFLWVDQKNLGFDEDTQTKVQLLTDRHPTYGEPLQVGKYLSHIPKLKSGKAARGGLIFTVSVLWLMKSYVTRDWLQFSEVFGMPIRYAKAVGILSDTEKADVFKALQALGSNASALFSSAVEVEFLGVNSVTHGDFYENAVRWFDSQTSKVVLGQTMTSDDGSSLAQAEVHDKVRHDIRNSDAKALASLLNRQLIRPMVDFNFGAGTPAPRFAFDIAEPEDLVAEAKILKELRGVGLPIAQREVYERFSYTQPEDGEAVLPPPGAASAAQDDGDGDGDLDEDGITAMAASKVLGVPLSMFFSIAQGTGIRARRDSKGRRRFTPADVEAFAELQAKMAGDEPGPKA